MARYYHFWPNKAKTFERSVLKDETDTDTIFFTEWKRVWTWSKSEDTSQALATADVLQRRDETCQKPGNSQSQGSLFALSTRKDSEAQQAALSICGYKERAWAPKPKRLLNEY